MKPPTTFDGNIVDADDDEIVKWLELAEGVAENKAQGDALALLISYYKTGDLQTWDDYNVACALLQPTIAKNPDGTEKMPSEVWDEEAQRISGFIGLGNESFGKPKEIRT